MKQKQALTTDILDAINTLSPERRGLLALKLKAKQRSARDKRDVEASADLYNEAGKEGSGELVSWVDRNLRAPAITPAPRDGEIPLSFSQYRLWFLDQLEPNSAVYNVVQALRIEGQLNARAIDDSFREVINRHESLRTTFVSRAGRPSQVIAPNVAWNLPVVDLQGIPEHGREAEVRLLANQEAGRPFDLSRGPLFRITLIRLHEEDHVLLLTLHHIISDGWSMGVLVNEVMALYEASSAGSPSPLPELALQYADYAYWQQNWLQGEALEQQLSFWREQLKGSPSQLDLVTDFPRPAYQTFRGSYRALALSPTLSQQIESLGRRRGASVFMTMLAAFNLLLYKYTGQDDIVVGTPIANRSRAEIEALIGFFTNTLALRTDISRNPSFAELLDRVRQMTLAAYAHQDLPFEKLVEELRPERSLNRQPLFQVMFSFQALPGAPVEIPRLKLSSFNAENLTAKFDLTCYVMESGQGLVAALEYNSDLFRPDTIDNMLANYETLLKNIVANPSAHISELAILTEAGRLQITNDFNNTQRGYPQDACIHDLFEAQAAKSPDEIAVVFEDRSLSYSELNRLANRLAHYLIDLGVGPDVRVAICMQRSLDLAVAVLGVLKAGGAYLPLDVAYPAERISLMLEDSQASVLLTHARLAGEFSERGPRIVCMDQDWPIIAEYGPENPQSGVTPDNLAYVIYTSGSTGKPKGVALCQKALYNLISWQLETPRLCKAATTLQFTSLIFDVSFQELFSTWCSGGTLVLVSEQTRTDPRALLGFLNEKRIERLYLPFVALQQLAEECERERVFPTSLCDVITAGEQLRITGPILTLFENLNGCVLHNHYGPSETHVVTAFGLRGPSEQWPMLPPIGAPIANTQTFILDRDLQPAPVGARGELFISGANLARGYLGCPDLTAERFIPNPYSTEPGARLYKTGDLARYQLDGNIEFLGRADHQVKIRGYRIEPGEVEAALEAHPAIRGAAVLARDDGYGNNRLVAYIVANEKPGPSVSQLQNFLRTTLPDYMVPSLFKEIDELPLTATGKLDRRALPEPDRTRPDQDVAFLAPRNAAEEIIAEIWANLLRLERVGVHDRFFELGGHSLLATQVISRVSEAFQIELPLRSLFERPTVEGLALTVTEAWGGEEIVEEIAATWKQVQQLSEQEVAAMLSEGRAQTVG